MLNLVPRDFFSVPRFPSVWDDEDDLWTVSNQPSGLTVSEDEHSVFVEAAVPGIDPEKVEITFDKGVLWIKGQKETEETNKNRKYYRKASSAFSYRVSVPGEIDQNKDPEAVCKNGVMKIVFAKKPENQPKRIVAKKE